MNFFVPISERSHLPPKFSGYATAQIKVDIWERYKLQATNSFINRYEQVFSKDQVLNIVNLGQILALAVENIKYIFKEMFKEQEKDLLNIVSRSMTPIIQKLIKLS